MPRAWMRFAPIPPATASRSRCAPLARPGSLHAGIQTPEATDLRAHRGTLTRCPLPLPRAPQVLDAPKTVVDKPARAGVRPQKIMECLVGDASGVILFTARNEQGAQ